MIIQGKIVHVFDIEVFPNVFSCTVKNTESGHVVVFEISSRTEHCGMEALSMVNMFLNKHFLFCGYNNIHYDNPIINFFIKNIKTMPADYRRICDTIYKLSQKIVNSESTEGWKELKYANNFATLDLLTMLFSQKLRVGLKEMQVTMQYHNVQEYEGDFDAWLPEEEIDKMLSYNLNDVESTEELLNRCKADIDLRIGIQEEFGVDVLSKDGMTIAFLAYCMYDSPWLGQVRLAEENVPGISPLDITKVVEDIRMAKKNYDKVVVLPHWGKEYSYEPLPETIEIAKQMVQAGADAVIGTHPHQVQPMIKIKGVPVCFSMGNFLFPDFYMQPPRPIWYPDADIDRATIPSVDSYIFPVEKPVLRVWEPLSRYGMSVDVRLSPHHRISVNPVFTHLSYNNNLCKSGPAKGMRSRLWKESAKIKCSWIRRMSESLRQRKREKLQKQ